MVALIAITVLHIAMEIIARLTIQALYDDPPEVPGFCCLFSIAKPGEAKHLGRSTAAILPGRSQAV